MSRIDELVESKTSIMPRGLAAKLADRQEFLDLVKFLSVLGKPGEYAVSNKPVIRRWRVKPLPSGGQAGYSTSSFQGTPAYSLVSGELPLKELERTGGLLVSAEVKASRSGMATLVVDVAAGLELYVNGQATDLNRETEVTLTPGVNVLKFAVRASERAKDSLRVELQEVSGGASFEIVNGI
jgi:hypothetical protein